MKGAASWLLAGVILAIAAGCASADAPGDTVTSPGGEVDSTETSPTQAPAFSPSPDQIAAFPADFGLLVEQDGKYFLNDSEVVFTLHTEPDGSPSVWMSLPDQTDWPLFIQPQGGAWTLGVAEWNGGISLVNTTDLTIPLTIGGAEELTGSEEPSEGELSPYEIFEISFLPPGDYVFGFAYADTHFECNLHFAALSSYQFILLPEGIILLSEGFVPQTAAEFNILNSPLCMD